MPPASDDAPLGGLPPGSIEQLAVFYDRFANALDPFAPARDQAEALFDLEVARLFARTGRNCSLEEGSSGGRCHRSAGLPYHMD